MKFRRKQFYVYFLSIFVVSKRMTAIIKKIIRLEHFLDYRTISPAYKGRLVKIQFLVMTTTFWPSPAPANYQSPYTYIMLLFWSFSVISIYILFLEWEYILCAFSFHGRAQTKLDSYRIPYIVYFSKKNCFCSIFGCFVIFVFTLNLYQLPYNIDDGFCFLCTIACHINTHRTHIHLFMILQYERSTNISYFFIFIFIFRSIATQRKQMKNKIRFPSFLFDIFRTFNRFHIILLQHFRQHRIVTWNIFTIFVNVYRTGFFDRNSTEFILLQNKRLSPLFTN